MSLLRDLAAMARRTDALRALDAITAAVATGLAQSSAPAPPPERRRRSRPGPTAPRAA